MVPVIQWKQYTDGPELDISVDTSADAQADDPHIDENLHEQNCKNRIWVQVY